jgi:hypothetical protein
VSGDGVFGDGVMGYKGNVLNVLGNFVHTFANGTFAIGTPLECIDVFCGDRTLVWYRAVVAFGTVLLAKRLSLLVSFLGFIEIGEEFFSLSFFVDEFFLQFSDSSVLFLKLYGLFLYEKPKSHDTLFETSDADF